MAKKLAALLTSLKDVQTRSQNVGIDKLVRINTNFWQHLDLVFDGITVMNERIVALQAGGAPGNTVADFLNDNDVKTAYDAVEEYKAQCRKESDDYYKIVARLAAIHKEVVALHAAAEQIVKDKQKKWLGSSSLPAVKDASTSIREFGVELHSAITAGGPHKSSHALIQPGG